MGTGEAGGGEFGGEAVGEEFGGGDEFGGGLWFENNKLTDYDGISDFLPLEVVEAIINFGFVVTDEFFDKDENE